MNNKNLCLNIKNLISKNFSTKAKIKFIGKRSLFDNKHNEKNETSSLRKSTSPASNQTSKIHIPLSSFTLNSYRLQMSKEEMEIVNNGGPINFPDWAKIKLKPKNK